MDCNNLKRLKCLPKRLRAVSFKPLRRNQLPRPFDKMGGPRITHSGLLEVGAEIVVLFVCRDGERLERRAFFAHVLEKSPRGLVPLVILHYHPSHKGLHLLLNCRDDCDYTERQLPGAPELALKTPNGIDPGSEQGRLRLVNIFCERCGIRIAPDDEQLL